MANNAFRYSQYQYGSAAPQVEPLKIRQAKSAYMKQARAEVEKKADSKRKAAEGYTFLQSALIVLAVAAILAIAGFYIVTISETYTLKRGIEDMKRSYQMLTTENMTEMKKADNTVDYEAIYAYVTETLGMKIPEKQQIIHYAGKQAELVTKEAEIPNE